MPRGRSARKTRKMARKAARTAAKIVAQGYLGRRNPLYSRKYGRRRAHGFFTLVRKLPIMTLTSSGTLGNVLKDDPTGSCISIGTPQQSSGSLNGWDVPFSMKFSLNQLLSFSDVTQIADQYKILSVMIRLSQAVNITTNSAFQTPYIEYIQDYDDATVPTITALRTKMGVKTKYFGPRTNRICMGVRPRVADEVYNTGSSTAYAVNSRSMWLNCDYASVEHYGIKGILHNMYLPGGGANLNSTFTFDVSFKVAAKDLQ